MNFPKSNQVEKKDGIKVPFNFSLPALAPASPIIKLMFLDDLQF
jgi:hypothetical protein